MIDTHAHLDFPEYGEDREDVISRAFDSGVRKIINVGVDIETSRKSIELSGKHEKIFAAVGLHPEFFTQHIAHNTQQKWKSDLKEIARHKKVVAIGETGLDYFRETHNAQRKTQKEGFISQIEIAQELGLPVIVHCREAWDDLFAIISGFFLTRVELSSLLKFVLHCYSGENKDTEKFLKLPNVYFSFSGNITYPKPADRADRLAEAVRRVPLGRMMLDSDSPLLAPQEFRGKRNEPAYVKYIAQKIAEIKGISGEEVEEITDLNAVQFFRFDLI